MRSHQVWLTILCLWLTANSVSSLYFDDISSSDSSDSNSTESDEWTDPFLQILGPFLGGAIKTTTTSRPVAKPANTSTQANSTVSSTASPTVSSTTAKPTPTAVIKCSTKPNEQCPSNCMTDSAVIHGFCCNCKHPLDIKVRPGYLCPASTVCPANTTKLCDLFSRLMVCCCQDDFMPKPSTLPPPVKPIPPPSIGPQTPPLPPAGQQTPPKPPVVPPSATDSPGISQPLPPAAVPPSSIPANSPPPVAIPPSPSSPPDTASPLPPPRPPAPVDEKPSIDVKEPSNEKLPVIVPSEKSKNHNIVVEIDSVSVEDEIVELPLNFRRAPRKTSIPTE